MAVAAAIVSLPGGLWRDRVCLRKVGIRAVNGEDELWLVEQSVSLSLPERVSGLLERCVTTLPKVAVRLLSAGDREALSLHLHNVTFGDRVAAVVPCLRCTTELDLDLEATGMLVKETAQSVPWHELDGVRFRLPNGEDLELAARADSPGEGARIILQRCLGESQVPLDDDLATRIVARMAELDPQAETRLDLQCPECGHAFQTIFDAGAYLLRELDMRRGHLLREVHRMASYYHWSEETILRMARTRRHAYLDLIAASLEGRRG